MKPYRITNQTGYHVSSLSAIITAKDPPSLGLIYPQIALPGFFFLLCPLVLQSGLQTQLCAKDKSLLERIKIEKFKSEQVGKPKSKH